MKVVPPKQYRSLETGACYLWESSWKEKEKWSPWVADWGFVISSEGEPIPTDPEEAFYSTPTEFRERLVRALRREVEFAPLKTMRYRLLQAGNHKECQELFERAAEAREYERLRPGDFVAVFGDPPMEGPSPEVDSVAYGEVINLVASEEREKRLFGKPAYVIIRIVAINDKLLDWVLSETLHPVSPNEEIHFETVLGSGRDLDLGMLVALPFEWDTMHVQPFDREVRWRGLERDLQKAPWRSVPRSLA